MVKDGGHGGSCMFSPLHMWILQYDVENFVELCTRSSQSIESIRKRARKKSLNQQLMYGDG